MTTAAHTQTVKLTILEFFPAHEPRAGDPHYHVFNAARAKLKAAGKLICWICGQDEKAAGAPIELHHAHVEYALANGIDLTAFETKFPEFCHLNETEAEFLDWVEGEGNLLPLCLLHHRGEAGIHSLTYPTWVAQAAWKQGLTAPGRLVPAVSTGAPLPQSGPAGRG